MKTERETTRNDTGTARSAGSLNRAVVLLNTIAADSRKGSSMTRLVSRTGLPRPTIHRILKMLMAIGWVERDEHSGRYNLGFDLAALGYSAMCRHPIERVAHTELSRLAMDLNQTVYLDIRSGLDTVCIGRYDSGSEIQAGKGWVGMRGPFGMTPACLGMFACMPKHEVDEIVAANMTRYHRIEGFDEKGYHETLAESFRAGFGIYNNILLDHTTSGLGVAICDSTGYPVAGISTVYITGWLDERQRRECLQRMQQSATAIAERLFALASKSRELERVDFNQS